MNTGIVFNIQRFCIHDGDGIRTCVFLKGCPLRCVWCHNPESLDSFPTVSFDKKKCTYCGKCLIECPARTTANNSIIINRNDCLLCGKCIEACPNNASDIIGKQMTVSEVFDEVIKDKLFYEASDGGITITGGEPSYQPEFTTELLSRSRDAGISLAIETCGIGSREFYKLAADLGATFLYDIKCIDPVLHKKLTGSDNAHIMSNLCYLMDRNADVIIRLPLVPGCNDSDQNIEMLSIFLNRNKGRYRYAEIMPYHTLGTGKCERIGITPDFTHENATAKDISRWISIFNANDIDIKVSE